MDDILRVDRARATIAACESRAAAAKGMGNLLQIAASAFELAARDLAVRASEPLQSLLAAGLEALMQAGDLHRSTYAALRNDGWAPVRLADVLGKMRPQLDHVIGPAMRCTMDLCRHLPLIRCNSVGLEGAILSIMLHLRREARSRGDLRLSAIGRLDPRKRAVVLIEALLSDPAWTGVCQSRHRGGQHACGPDEIGLAAARLFAQSIGGRMALDRTVPQRLRIALWLPCLPGGSDQLPSEALAGRSVADGREPGRRIKPPADRMKV